MKGIFLISVAVLVLIVCFAALGIKLWRESRSPYSDIVLQLPMPTAEQTQHFAEYVTKARNWYKIIPAFPEAPIVFYLDPDAGRHWVRKTAGLNLSLDSELDFTAIEEAEVVFEDAERAHQYQRVWDTTEEYRSRFGFWNFYAPYPPYYEILMGNGDTIVTAGPGFKIRSGSGWCNIPKKLEVAGIAPVSSLMYPFNESYPHFADGLVGVFIEPAGKLKPLLQTVLDLKNLRKEVTEATKKGGSPDYRAWKKTDEFKRLEEQIENPLNQERSRQIEEMVYAMQRFLEKLDEDRQGMPEK